MHGLVAARDVGEAHGGQLALLLRLLGVLVGHAALRLGLLALHVDDQADDREQPEDHQQRTPWEATAGEARVDLDPRARGGELVGEVLVGGGVPDGVLHTVLELDLGAELGGLRGRLLDGLVLDRRAQVRVGERLRRLRRVGRAVGGAAADDRRERRGGGQQHDERQRDGDARAGAKPADDGPERAGHGGQQSAQHGGH